MAFSLRVVGCYGFRFCTLVNSVSCFRKRCRTWVEGVGFRVLVFYDLLPVLLLTTTV